MQPSTPIDEQPQNNTQPNRPNPIVTLTPDIFAAETPAMIGDEPLRWRAQEYVHHDKNPLWYTVFGLVVVVLMVIAIVMIKSLTFAILIPVMAAAIIVYSQRPPRTLDYTLSRHGLHINDILYSFSDFKGFKVIDDGEEYSIALLPIKRFKPSVSVYFPEDAGEAIVDMLSARLPLQAVKLDVFDKIIRKLRL